MPRPASGSNSTTASRSPRLVIAIGSDCVPRYYANCDMRISVVEDNGDPDSPLLREVLSPELRSDEELERIQENILTVSQAV